MEVLGYVLGVAFIALAIRAWLVLGKVSEFIDIQYIELTKKSMRR